MSHHHLTLEQRSQIYALKSMGHCQKEIAACIGVHPSTISRELKRNTGLKGYRYKQAHRLATTRKSEASKTPKKMTAPMTAFIEKKLTEEQWSPEQISGVLKANKCDISFTRIYQHIWRDKKQGGTLYKNLRHRGKKYRYKGGKVSGRGCIPHRIDISERPKIVEKKTRFGDWEADTLIGAHHQGAIVSLVDRKSKFVLLSVVSRTQAEQVSKALCQAVLNHEFELPVHTITYDNGREFSSHQKTSSQLGSQAYFATPYHSWERGLNEHTNGLVRQYLPKKTDFQKIDKKEVRKIQDKLNNRPRKVLGYRTPLEVLQGQSRPQKIAIRC